VHQNIHHKGLEWLGYNLLKVSRLGTIHHDRHTDSHDAIANATLTHCAEWTRKINCKHVMTVCEYLFSTGNKFLKLIMQRLQQTFTLLILTSKAGQHNWQKWLIAQQWCTTQQRHQKLSTHQQRFHTSSDGNAMLSLGKHWITTAYLKQ